MHKLRGKMRLANLNIFWIFCRLKLMAMREEKNSWGFWFSQEMPKQMNPKENLF